MADQDLERLVLTISADVRQMNRALGRLNQDVTRSTKQVENRFNKMGANITRGLGRVFAAFSVAQVGREVIELADRFTQIQNALRVTGLEGEALTRVYDRLYQSAQRNAAPLDALVSLYRRLGLAQKELGVNTQDILGFTDRISAALRIQGVSAEDARGPLLQLAQAMGSGIVRAEEFNSIIEGVPVIAQAAAAGLEEAGGSVAKLRQLVIEGEVSSKAFFEAIRLGSSSFQNLADSIDLTVGQSMGQLGNSLVNFVGQLDRSFGATGKLSGAIGTLTEAIDSLAAEMGNADSWAGNFVNLLAEGASQAADFAGKMNVLALAAKAYRAARGISEEDSARAAEVEQRARATETLTKKLLAQQAAAASLSETETKAAEAISDRINRAFGGGKTTSIKDNPVAPGSGGGAGRRTRENFLDRELRQLREATEIQKQELELMGQTEYARERARALLEIENAAKREGITLSEEQRARAEAVADAYAQSTEAVRQATERQQALTDLQREFGNIAINSIQGLIDGSMSLNDVLGNVLKTLAQMALQAAILGEGPLANLFGTGGKSGGVGGIFGALFGRAAGGPVQRKPYLVGENGPEIFIPNVTGRIDPNNVDRAAKSSEQAAQTVVFNNDFRGVSAADRAYTDAKIAQLERQVVTLPKTLPQTWRNQPSLRA